MTDFELPLLQIDAVFTEDLLSGDIAVINRDPSPGETNVPVDTRIAFTIASFNGTEIAEPLVRVLVNGVVAFSYSDGIVPEFHGSGSSFAFNGSRINIVLVPIAPLPSATRNEVIVEGATTAGITLRNVFSFTTEDKTGPVVVGALALDTNTVRVEFDEPVVTVDVLGSFSFEALTVPAVTPLVVGVEFSESFAIVTLDTELTPDAQYRIRALDVQDSNSNSVVEAFNSTTFVGFRPPQPPGRDFSLWRMLPRHNRRSDFTGDLAKFCGCLQDVLDLLLWSIDRWCDIFDYERAPEVFVDLILIDLGNPFAFDLTLADKRRLAALLVQIYSQKGTKPGVINAVRFFLAIEVDVVTYTSEVMTLGESLLGVDWIVGPRLSFDLYAFNVVAPRVLTTEERKRIRTIVNYIRPGHTHFVDLIEPEETAYVAYHWEVGESLLGVNTILHSAGETPVASPPYVVSGTGSAESYTQVKGYSS